MEVKEAPPATSTGSGDGSDDIRVMILANARVLDGTTNKTVIEALQAGFVNAGTPLVGGYVMRAICHCDKGCPEGTIYGLVLPRTDEAVKSICDFYIAVHGDHIRDTTDPDVVRGVFKAMLD